MCHWPAFLFLLCLDYRNLYVCLDHCSRSRMNSQVHLNPTRLSILSIPRSKYWVFLSPILQMLHHEADQDAEEDSDSESESESESDDDEEDQVESSKDDSIDEQPSPFPTQRRSSKDLLNHKAIDNSSKVTSEDSQSSPFSSPSTESDDSEIDDDNHFFHIGFTPIECTIICSTCIMNEYFIDALKICQSLEYDDVKLIKESFISLQIDSDGSFNHSLRILELTRPLSENNIPLFFISSHYCDIVLIPVNFKEKVIHILTQKNFEFSENSNSYISNIPDINLTDQLVSPINKDLESSIFKSFHDCHIKPVVNSKINLLLTGARTGESSNTINKTIKIISTNSIPDYFIVTRTSINKISLVLPKSKKTRKALGFDSSNLIGSTQDIIIPISIDLAKLPLDSTGIVAGLASKIINNFPQDLQFEMNYLSMARSGILMIPKENLSVIKRILNDINYDNLDNVGASCSSLQDDINSLKV